MQKQIIDKKLKFYTINAVEVARETGMGQRINTIMQACFFAISNILPREQAIAEIKNAIKKTYSKKGDAIVQKNFAAVDASLAHMHEVAIPAEPTSALHTALPVPADAPEFIQKVTGEIIAGRGEQLPVSCFCRRGRRHLADRHDPVRKALHRDRNPGMGSGNLYPVRQMLYRLPARRYPYESRF